jgi:acetyl esterase/lipase
MPHIPHSELSNNNKMKNRPVQIFVFVVILSFALHVSAQETENKIDTKYLLEDFDKNGDGKLSIEEFPEEKRHAFKQVDDDGDGFITREEEKIYRKGRPEDRAREKEKKGVIERRTEYEGDTRIEKDIIYAVENGRKLPLDVYIPEKKLAKGKPLPVVLWYHGGGWKGGSKSNGGIAKGITEYGYMVISVEYRLSGEALFPAQVQDSKSAVRWVRANAEEWGFDPDNIGVMGRSAGGHLVAFLGTTGDIREYDTESNAGYSSRVQAVVDLWGASDLLLMDEQSLPGSRIKHNSADSPEGRLLGGPITEEPFRSMAVKVNPITYIKKGQDLPPFLLIHGDSDLSVPVGQSKILHAALQEAGGESILHIEKGAGHGLRDGEMDYDELREMAAKFFDKHLKCKIQ